MTDFTFRSDIIDTVTLNTLIDVEGSIKSFKLQPPPCSPWPPLQARHPRH